MINSRIKLLYLLLVVLFLYLAGKLFYLQILKHHEYSKKAEKQRSYTVELIGHRGRIFDRNGVPLAINQESVSVYAIPREFTEKTLTELPRLSQILDLPLETLSRQVQSHRNFFWIQRQLPLSSLESLKEIKAPGVGWIKEEKRVYPQGTLAGQVLGFTGVDNQGLEGLEQYYDGYLKGEKGEAVLQYDAKGYELFAERRVYREPKAGADIYLTLDAYLQYMAEQELTKGLILSKSKRGAILMLDPKTGEILANAVAPVFDPNHFIHYSAAIRKNWAITDLYEPGSTFKIFTVASALQERIITPSSTFQDNGFMSVGDRVIKNFDSYDKIHGLITVGEILKLSSNVGSAQIGLLMSKDRFRKYLVNFGFGTKTGIDFPGENPGLIPQLRDWNPVVQSNISFGQGIAITPIGLLCAVSALSNQGQKIYPHFLKKSSAKIPLSKKKLATLPLREQVMKEIQSMMVQVVMNKGTGKGAALDHYTVAGKTGTAQKAKPGGKGYLPDSYMVSFVGFFPAEDPKLAILVIFDEPQPPYQQGGALAAPVFKAVAEKSARYLHIAPSKLN